MSAVVIDKSKAESFFELHVSLLQAIIMMRADPSCLVCPRSGCACPRCFEHSLQHPKRVNCQNRRRFLNPAAWLDACRPEANEFARTNADRNDLFLRAMAKGIDPATINPERLPEILGAVKGGKASGNDKGHGNAPAM